VRGWRSVLMGFSMAAISCLILSGSLLLSLVENGSRSSHHLLEKTTMITSSPLATQFIIPGRPTSTYTQTSLATYTSTPTFIPPSACPPPSGWVAIIIQPDDTLAGLSSLYGVEEDTITSGNCIEVGITTLQAGMVFYIPRPKPFTQPPSPSPSLIKPTIYCFHPPGWVVYIVRPGDSLSSLGQKLNISISQLQSANCMGTSTFIRSGQKLLVPRLPPVATFQQPFPPSIPPYPITPIYTYVAPPSAPIP